MGAHGHISLPVMACCWYEGIYNGYQHESNGCSELEVVRRLYKEIITNGDMVSLMDLSKSLTTAERKVLNGHEGRMKSLKAFLNRHSHSFKIFRDSGKGKELVRPVIGIEFCKVFDSKQGCSDQYCPKLHICRHFVKGKCTFGAKCKKPHHFDDPHTLSILRRHYLDELEHSQLKEFLCRNVQFALDDLVNESSLPKQLEICKYYNVAIGCSREGLCPFLHVCRFFAEDGTCKFGHKCIRKHDCANEHSRLLLQRYNIKESDVFSYLRKGVISGRESSPPPDKCSPLASFPRGRTMSLGTYELVSRDQLIPRRVSEPSSLYQRGGMLICIEALKGQCKMKSCDKIHRPVPYCWQYSFDCLNWIEVGTKDNVKIEATFVDPYKDDIEITVCEKERITFKFTDWIGILQSPRLKEKASFVVSIRRLSTATSYTYSKEDADFATKWIWYYLDDECKWRGCNEMAQIKNEKVPAIDSSDIETAFWLDKEFFEYKCDGELFVINFKTMTQENRNTEQTTQVKRRPKFFDFNKLYKRDRGDIQSEKSFVPCYWKTDALPGISGGDFGQYELIELEPYSREYFNVFYDVGQSMGCENIFMIVAVQNLRLWMTYTMERDKLAEKNQCKAEEMTLYCAVLWQDAEQICRYGFENDAALGKGIHKFAKDAMTANKIKNADDDGIVVTFHCRVLKDSCLSTDAIGFHCNTHSVQHDTCYQHFSQATYYVSDTSHIYPEFIILFCPERKFPLQHNISLYK